MRAPIYRAIYQQAVEAAPPWGLGPARLINFFMGYYEGVLDAGTAPRARLVGRLWEPLARVALNDRARARMAYLAQTLGLAEVDVLSYVVRENLALLQVAPDEFPEVLRAARGRIPVLGLHVSVHSRLVTYRDRRAAAGLPATLSETIEWLARDIGEAERVRQMTHPRSADYMGRGARAVAVNLPAALYQLVKAQALETGLPASALLSALLQGLLDAAEVDLGLEGALADAAAPVEKRLARWHRRARRG